MSENIQTEHKRRIRYSGTHPKKFSEKYKELNPEKYKEDVEKIIASGKTPAGTHIPIMVDEILNILDIQPGQTGYDATLGYGGHTLKMLEKLNGKGHLYATDIDMTESVKTENRIRSLGYGEDIFTVKRINFRYIDEISPDKKFDFVLADLGVSSMQIDNPERGFTFKADGPLDLRLNQTSGITAADRLKELSYSELVNLFTENSDEPYSENIAKAILRAYKNGECIETTTQLHNIIATALSFLPKKEQKEQIKKSSQRVFQALRIEVNSEFEVLTEFLTKLPETLKPGGRVAILTFHSGEDRLVKKAFKQGFNDGIYSDFARDVIRPDNEECYKNPRSKSTKLRWAVKSK